MNGNAPADPEATAREEAELVTQAIAGHAPAFDALVRAHHRRAVAVAYRLLGNAEDAADVAQDAFVRAYRNLKTLKDRRRFGPWLMRIVSNLSLNYRRSRKAGSAVSLEDIGEPRGARDADVLAGLASGSNPLSNELESAVRRALNELPEKQRLSLVLFSMEGMPQKDVADMLGCTVELVKWNVFQARKKLKESLADYL